MLTRSITIQPPAWIFILTLLAIVATGKLVGSSPCARVLDDCYSTAKQAHPLDEVRQASYAASCLEQPCEARKRGALVPLSILILGIVVLRVWLGQRAPEDETPDDTRVPTRAPASAAGRENTPRTSLSQSPVDAPSAIKAPVDGLSLAQRNACLETLAETDDKSRAELVYRLKGFIGGDDTQQWKAAPLSDLILLCNCLALGALLGPEKSKYRRELCSFSGETDALSGADLNAQTKKGLLGLSLDTLRTDLHDFADMGAYPASVARQTVTNALLSLSQDDALAGLLRCSKQELVHLAEVLSSK